MSPKAKEWEIVRVFVKILKIFYDAANRFLGFLYVTTDNSF
mgnify:CR=1 FL=1